MSPGCAVALCSGVTPTDPSPGNTGSAEPATGIPYPSRPYAWYVVGLLTVAFVSSFIDRQILGLLVTPIRRDLGISDTGMSLLMGLSFALFYTVLGFPIGWLADRWSRRGIIGIAIAVWSIMTMAGGMARNYSQLFLARIGVGVGEAGLSPPAYSLIADYFPRDRLATAISVYSMGIYIGAGLANVVGGMVVGAVSVDAMWTVPLFGIMRPWQVVFLVIGAPGLLLALLTLTIREPVRRDIGPGMATVPVRAVFTWIKENARTFVHHHGGLALISLANYGLASWAPTFMVRTYGWEVSRAGIALGIITGVFGPLGIVAGGWYADRLMRRGRTDAKLLVAAVAASGLLVTDLLFPLMPTAAGALVLFVPLSVFAAVPFGVGAAAVQELFPNQMRAQGSALYLFALSIIGLGVGPTGVALLTDYVFRDDAALRYSLAVASTVAMLGAVALLWTGLGAYRESVRYRAEWGR